MHLMIEAARDAGVSGLAFTEHVEWHMRDSAYGYLQPSAYFDELQNLRARHRDDMRLLAGLELGNPHEYASEAQALLASAPWDYVLGSLHWQDDEPGWKPSTFAEGLEIAYDRYFRELNLLAKEGEYDVLAHFDLIRRDSWNVCRQTLPVEPYAPVIRETLQAVIERGKGLEINTSGLAYGLSEPCPGIKILRWYHELGGDILVFGSDAHYTADVGQHFDRARALAREAGFEQLALFKRRRVVDWIPL
jgi:histidinol-phosphatase (PHP family)